MSTMVGARRYDSMKFPVYEYRPYPRWVTNHDGKKVIVQNAREELEVAAEPKDDARDAVKLVDKLKAEATSKDAKIAALEAQLVQVQSGRATTPTASAAVTKAATK